MHDIARNLKCLRRQRGLTQEELAARLHVTRQAVSNWERNRNLPELEILLSAAELLGVGVDELLYGPRPAEGAAAPANRRRRTVTAGALWAVWAALWLVSFILSGYFGDRFAGGMPAFTVLGFHPSFAPTIFLYWIGGQLTLNLGLYLLQDEWLSQKDWDAFCDKVKGMKGVK